MQNNIVDPLKDGKSSIQLIDHMGNDLSVVNDARTSYDRASESLTDKDLKLLDYLIKNKHFSPLRGVVFKFKVAAPLFVARQWYKHAIASSHCDEQLSWNEKSFRYTQATDSNLFYLPAEFLTQSKTNKQKSGSALDFDKNIDAIAVFESQCEMSFDAYQNLIDLGVSRELARCVLVPSVYTTWVWTASLQAVLNFLDLRTRNGAQNEITQYAIAVKALIEPCVPCTLEIWEDYYAV